MHTRRGLGRGLGALIPPAPGDDGPATSRELPEAPDAAIGILNSAVTASHHGAELRSVHGVTYAEIPVEQVRPNPRQPRKVFDEDEMAELVHSVKEIGVLQPIVVRPTGSDSYELVMGERRWRASQQAGLNAVPAIVRQTPESDLLRDALLENLHRSQLNPLEEAAAYRQLLDDFECSQEELAGRIGRSRPHISNTLRLLRLSPSVQRRVAVGVLSAGHAKVLVALTDADAQERLATRIVTEGLSVRATEEVVAVGTEDAVTAPRLRRVPPGSPSPEIEERLSERLETRVRIQAGRSHGRIVIDYATAEDLTRIADLVDPPERNGDFRPASPASSW